MVDTYIAVGKSVTPTTTVSSTIDTWENREIYSPPLEKKPEGVEKKSELLFCMYSYVESYAEADNIIILFRGEMHSSWSRG